jgi:putative transcriptional regulator
MPSAWPLRLGAALLLTLLPALPLGAAAPADETPSGDPLVGQLLIASPDMRDPIFYHTVVLVVEHSDAGALGIIINRPVEDRSLASLLQAIGQTDASVKGSVPIYAGGPVEPWIGFILHSPDYHRADTRNIDSRVALTSNPQILHDIGHDRGPRKKLIAFGYTGWGPGQLEVELARHDWFTAPEDPRLIFDDDRKKVWDDAMARRAREL